MNRGVKINNWIVVVIFIGLPYAALSNNSADKPGARILPSTIQRFSIDTVPPVSKPEEIKKEEVSQPEEIIKKVPKSRRQLKRGVINSTIPQKPIKIIRPNIIKKVPGLLH